MCSFQEKQKQQISSGPFQSMYDILNQEQLYVTSFSWF